MPKIETCVGTKNPARNAGFPNHDLYNAVCPRYAAFWTLPVFMQLVQTVIRLTEPSTFARTV
jgi:hypothetical protein